jgi:hypothetical protein
VNGQVRLFDKRVGPNPAHELFLLHQLAVAFEQYNQDIDSLAGKRRNFPIPKQQMLRPIEKKGAEPPLLSFWPIHGDLGEFRDLFRVSLGHLYPPGRLL